MLVAVTIFMIITWFAVALGFAGTMVSYRYVPYRVVRMFVVFIMVIEMVEHQRYKY